MPGIIVCNRRWGVGSDDFVFPAIAELFLRSVWLISLIIVFVMHNDILLVCTDGILLRTYYIGMIALLGTAILLSGATAYLSAQGTIVDSFPRRNVGHLLLARMAIGVADIGWTAIGSRWAFVETNCDSAVVIVMRCAVVVGWLIVLAMIVGIIVVFDPLGHHHHRPAADFGGETEQLWKWRCRLMCCCFTANNERTTNAFEDAAQIVSSYFKDIDVVPTDIAAAFVLIQRQQRMRATRLDVETRMLPDCAADTALKPSWMTVQTAAHYMKFAGACYGWPFFVFGNLCCGVCRLWSHCRCCSCIRQSTRKVLSDNCCMCHMSAILNHAGIEQSDILFATFSNEVYHTPFFIAKDDQQRSIIVAVRGTLSLSDALTDLSATPDVVPGIDAVPDPMAHRGILRAAKNVMDVIVQNQLLIDTFENYPNYKLVITGHSLGAGTAAILALLLRSTYPDLICFAYAPPGWLVSLPLSRYMKDFVCSTVVGNDLVPRLGLSTMERLKVDMIKAVNSCRLPKYRVLLSGVLNSVCCLPGGDGINESDTDAESSIPEQSQELLLHHHQTRRYTEERSITPSRQGAETDPIAETSNLPMTLYMPGRVMYLEEVEPSETCCGTSKYAVLWAAPEAFDEVIVTAKMVSDHLPDANQRAFDSVIDNDDVIQHLNDLDHII